MREREIVISTSGALLGALIALTPFNLFPVCTDLVKTAAGTMIPMACFWTGRFAVALGVLIVIFSVLIYPIKDPMARRVNSGFLAVLGVTTILLAGGFIGKWCADPSHPCRAQTAPALTWLGLALLIVGIVAFLAVRKEH